MAHPHYVELEDADTRPSPEPLAAEHDASTLPTRDEAQDSSVHAHQAFAVWQFRRGYMAHQVGSVALAVVVAAFMMLHPSDTMIAGITWLCFSVAAIATREAAARMKQLDFEQLLGSRASEAASQECSPSRPSCETVPTEHPSSRMAASKEAAEGAE